jgi:predicted transporter
VFLVVAGTALASGGVLAATVEFAGYALGMGAMLTVVILGATLFQAAVTRWTRAVAPHIHRLAAAFLLGAGIFIVRYWWTSGLVGA